MTTADGNTTGLNTAGYQCVAEQLGQRKLKRAITDPGRPVNWVLTVWRSNLIGSSGKGGGCFLRHLLGTDSNAQGTQGTQG